MDTRRHRDGTQWGEEGTRQQHSQSRVRFKKVGGPVGEEGWEGVGKMGNDAEQWLEMEEWDVEDFDVQQLQHNVANAEIKLPGRPSVSLGSETQPGRVERERPQQGRGDGNGTYQGDGGDMLVETRFPLRMTTRTSIRFTAASSRSPSRPSVSTARSSSRSPRRSRSPARSRSPLNASTAAAVAVLAPVGSTGPWRNPGILWQDSGSGGAIDLQGLHQNGKELSGFSLRRALKAIGHGASLTLSAVDAQVQRQLLLGVSSRGVPNCTIFEMPRHATVVQQGHVAQHMLVILQGRIKLWRSQRSSSGRGAEVVEGGLKELKEGESDTVLTECVGEVSEGGIVLEAEAALGLTSPYTAIVTSVTTSGGSPEGGGRGRVKRTGDAAQHVCEVLSVKGEALAALIDLYPSLQLSERLVLARKAFQAKPTYDDVRSGSKC